jgi:UDP-N-acetylmuramoyl-tripeptide--D-alanyl-D-alanine ligase
MKRFFLTAKYQIYLLQLENYELWRFLKLLFKKGLWPKGEQRKNLVWTLKAVLIFLGAEILLLAVSVAGILYFIDIFGGASSTYYVLSGLMLAAAFLLQFIFFIFLIFATWILWPLDFILKKILILRAASKINKLNVKVIGIAGSYGKTTMKQVLKEVLSTKYLVLSTPESVNTPVGIARWVLKEFPSSGNPPPSPQPSPTRGEGGGIQVALVEMGEHYRGDVEEICKIVKPDIAVVTGINEAHLERMKNLDTVTETIFEIVSGTKAGGLVVINGDDKNVMGHYKEYVWPDHKIERFTIEDLRFKNFNPEELGWEADSETIGKIKVNLLGEYGLGDVDAAIKIAQQLDMDSEDIKIGISKIKPVEHRLQPMRSQGNVLVIDDSYNGNPEGVKEAIKVLGRFTGRRKLFITPGLVETGNAKEEIHRQIGRQLASVADVVILIKNSVTKYIEEGMDSSLLALSPGFGQNRTEVGKSFQPLPNPLQLLERETNRKVELYRFDSAQEAHAALKDILKPGDVIVFQNDWGDQYI